MKYYHVWFQTKYRKYMLINEIDALIHDYFKLIAKEKQMKLLASGSLPEHVHVVLGLNEQQSLSWAVQMLKGISSHRIFQDYKWMKIDYRVNNLWQRKYGAKEVPFERLRVTIKYVLSQKKNFHVK